MFRCLAGRVMFTHENPMDRLLAVMSGPPPSLATVTTGMPADLVALVDCALAFQKNDRYPDALTMQRGVRQVYERIAASPMPNAQVVNEVAAWTVPPPHAAEALSPTEDIHVSVMFSDPGTGDSIVVDLEDLDSGQRARRELRRTAPGTDDEPLSEVIIVDTEEAG